MAGSRTPGSETVAGPSRPTTWPRPAFTTPKVTRPQRWPSPKTAEEAAEPGAVQLARALARVAALEDLVARQDDQLAFLRQLTVDTLAKRGAL